jgi:hypothetical protein
VEVVVSDVGCCTALEYGWPTETVLVDWEAGSEFDASFEADDGDETAAACDG